MKVVLFEKGKNLAEKQEFYAVDFFRLVAAFMVIAIHYPPFENVGYALSGGFSNILCRIAVPFFFLLSGYFLGERIKNSAKTISYVKKLIRFYLIYSVIYLPLSFYGVINKGYSIWKILVRYLRGVLLTGSYRHLWYFLALIVSVGLLYLIVNKVKINDKALSGLCFVIYFVGVVGCLFETELRSIVFLKGPIDFYFNIFDDTKNVFFFGFPFVALGYLVAKHREKFVFSTKYILFLIFSVGIMCVEKVVEMAVAVSVKQDMMISMVPTTCMLFLCIAFIKMKDSVGKMAELSRKMSMLIYVWHPFVGFCVEKVAEKAGYEVHSILMYTIVLVVSVVLSFAIIKMSCEIGFLKKIY